MLNMKRRVHTVPTDLVSEIREENIIQARRNVSLNGLEHRIMIRKPDDDELLLRVLSGDESFDFCMCNPPFFASEEEQEQSRNMKSEKPYAVSPDSLYSKISPYGVCLGLYRCYGRNGHRRRRIGVCEANAC